jgi:hypothetical protein
MSEQTPEPPRHGSVEDALRANVWRLSRECHELHRALWGLVRAHDGPDGPDPALLANWLPIARHLVDAPRGSPSPSMSVRELERLLDLLEFVMGALARCLTNGTTSTSHSPS